MAILDTFILLTVEVEVELEATCGYVVIKGFKIWISTSVNFGFPYTTNSVSRS